MYIYIYTYIHTCNCPTTPGRINLVRPSAPGQTPARPGSLRGIPRILAKRFLQGAPIRRNRNTHVLKAEIARTIS